MSLAKSEAPFLDMVSFRGVLGLCSYCVLPDCSEAWLLLIQECAVIRINLESGNIIKRLQLALPFPTVFCISFNDIHFSVIDSRNSQKLYGLILITEIKTNKCFAASFDFERPLRTPHETVKYIDTCELCVGVLPIVAKNGYLFEDANGGHYYIWCWRSGEWEENRRTLVHVIKLSVNKCGKIQLMTIIDQRLIRDLWFQPFIHDNSICFLPFNGEKHRMMRVPLDNPEKSQIFVIAGDDSGRRPPSDLHQYYKPNSVGENGIVYHISGPRDHGSLWVLDLKLKRWKLHVKLSDHVSALEICKTRNGRIFAHGSCAAKLSCSLDAHFFHFAVSPYGEKLILTTEQLAAIYSSAGIRFLHGPKNSGKSTVLLLAVMNFLENEASNPNDVRIFMSSPSQSAKMSNFLSTTYPIFDPDSVTLQRKNLPRIPKSCHLFIDDLKVLTLELHCFLRNRASSGNYSFVAMNHEISPGLDHPRAIGKSNFFSWHRLTEIFDNDSREHTNANATEQKTVVQEFSKDKSEHMLKKKNVTDDMETFVARSQEALNQLYPDWWTNATDKATVCIPACLDVGINKYRGTTDPLAASFDPVLFDRNKRHIVGHVAEKSFLQYFQPIKIGGVLISGFATSEFAKKNIHIRKLFRACKIEQFEIDFMFIHPRLGIYLIEVKGAKELQNKQSKQYQKAKEQLDRMLEQVPKIMKELTGENCDIPIYTAICFPLTSMENPTPASNHEFIDKNALQDKNILWKIFANKMQATTIALLDPLHQFACIVAGYRATEFTSAGQNALAIHKMIENQSFHNMKYEYNSAEQGIFLTNEQLAIIDCQLRFQMIVGPPGTGKTLILLMKALSVAKVAKKGGVIFIASRPQLCRKFQLFFESHSEELVRIPIIDTEVRAEIDDDVFFDEISLTSINSVVFLRERTADNIKGCTIAALTGMENPFQILNAKVRLKKLGLSAYHVFQMNTIYRNSGNIFDEVKRMFPTNTPLHLGHSIKGPDVKHFTDGTDTCERILTHIREFLRQGGLPKHICVITEEENDFISFFLASHDVASGSVDDQLIDPNLIAVDMFRNTLSFEWPMVIVVAPHCIKINESFLLVAASRCVVQLVIVTVD